MLAKGLFVTGTDTNVGKTVVAAALMHRLRREHTVCYYKPVQTGSECDDDARTVGELGSCTTQEICTLGLRLPQPLSPHLSAQLAGVSIDLDELAAPVVADPNVFWIVEGAGGVMAPLNDNQFVIDLMSGLNFPVVVVARSSLGTINHTLLTLEALRARSLTIDSVVMVGEPNRENRSAIAHYGNVERVLELPRFDHLTSSALAKWQER